ncbi:type II toxin-antitoxin system HicB family antitoxin [Photorhabdus luminescens]|uniref:type II toxin-antitoxin system HicB family antitoxin n=1 Tax=Photorhabdus TaxID=29487 RepID=UPI003D27A4DC
MTGVSEYSQQRGNLKDDGYKFDGRAERINITLPHRLLHRIDIIVHDHPEYGSRSGFLAQAARNELQKTI